MRPDIRTVFTRACARCCAGVYHIGNGWGPICAHVKAAYRLNNIGICVQYTYTYMYYVMYIIFLYLGIYAFTFSSCVLYCSPDGDRRLKSTGSIWTGGHSACKLSGVREAEKKTTSCGPAGKKAERREEEREKKHTGNVVQSIYAPAPFRVRLITSFAGRACDSRPF